MKKVLVVDDDADLRSAITMVLKGKYELKEAGNKAEAQSAFKAFKPDLILLDVMMDSISAGFELAREFRAASPSVKIIMLTGVDKEMNIDFKSEMGDKDWLPADDYISKPLVPKTLLEKISAQLA